LHIALWNDITSIFSFTTSFFEIAKLHLLIGFSLFCWVLFCSLSFFFSSFSDLILLPLNLHHRFHQDIHRDMRKI